MIESKLISKKHADIVARLWCAAIRRKNNSNVAQSKVNVLASMMDYHLLSDGQLTSFTSELSEELQLSSYKESESYTPTISTYTPKDCSLLYKIGSKHGLDVEILGDLPEKIEMWILKKEGKCYMKWVVNGKITIVNLY
jgi:hypothetical protein